MHPEDDIDEAEVCGDEDCGLEYVTLDELRELRSTLQIELE